MRRRNCLFVFLGLLSLQIGWAAHAESGPPAAASMDRQLALPSGVTLTVPRFWSVHRAQSILVLLPPETDTHVVIVDAGTEADVLDAAVKAWSVYRSGTVRRVTLATPRAPRNGWDEEVRLEYENSPSEHVDVVAIAFRHAARWTVLIQDGTDATVDKREAAIDLIFQSLRPAGFRRESFAGRRAHPLNVERIAALTSFVQTSMEELGVPGAALAFLDHGKVVFEGGIGLRELGMPLPVDAHTSFMIASNTKAMTTLLIAKVVDQGKLTWDEPVIRVFPSFRLGNEAITRQVLMRHLVCACTGMPRKDLEWILNTGPNTPVSSTFSQLAATAPTSGFGEVFQYNNLMAAAAGYIAGHILYPDRELGAAYDTAMQDEIFDPLEMHETTLDMDRALAGNHASPHGDDIDGKPRAVSNAINTAIKPYRATGGISSAHDLIKYVRLELAQGVLPDGTRLVSAKNLLIRRARGGLRFPVPPAIAATLTPTIRAPSWAKSPCPTTATT